MDVDRRSQPPPESRHLYKSFLRYTSIAALFVAGFLIAQRFLIVLLLAAKILGYGGALNAWRGPVDRRTVVHDGIPIDVYKGARSHSSILIVHGVNPTGKNSLDLIRISEGLAQIGYEVFVPDLEHLRKQHLRPEDAE